MSLELPLLYIDTLTELLELKYISYTFPAIFKSALSWSHKIDLDICFLKGKYNSIPMSFFTINHFTSCIV